ncbi:MAG: hypothetical protein K940chlam8_00458 [Chlamydiae bacterium]|nr:hypothetical protein [Chlamydiota bacterium]
MSFFNQIGHYVGRPSFTAADATATLTNVGVRMPGMFLRLGGAGLVGYGVFQTACLLGNIPGFSLITDYIHQKEADYPNFKTLLDTVLIGRNVKFFNDVAKDSSDTEIKDKAERDVLTLNAQIKNIAMVMLIGAATALVGKYYNVGLELTGFLPPMPPAYNAVLGPLAGINLVQ